MKKENINTELRAKELVPEKVTVAGKTYSVRRSGKALRKIIEMAPAEGQEITPSENIELLYRGLSVVLVDEGGNNPDPDMLEEEIDFEVAQELMEAFVPSPRTEPETVAQNGSEPETSIGT